MTKPADSFLQLTAAIYHGSMHKDQATAVTADLRNSHQDKKMRASNMFASLMLSPSCTHCTHCQGATSLHSLPWACDAAPVCHYWQHCMRR